MNKLEITIRNEKKILNSFYSELKEHGFSFLAHDGEFFNKIDSFEDILDLYHDLDEMTIYVQKGNLKASASFIFGNGEFGIFCMYFYSDSLEEFLTKTLLLMDQLVDEKNENNWCLID